MNYRILPFATALLVAQAQLPGAGRVAALEPRTRDGMESQSVPMSAPAQPGAPAAQPDGAHGQPAATPAPGPDRNPPAAQPLGTPPAQPTWNPHAASMHRIN